MAIMAGLLLLSAAASASVKTGTDLWRRGDYTGAVREWQGPAEAGDPAAEFNLAQAYLRGRGVKRDRARAEALFAQAAAKGHSRAADWYGLMLFDRGERTQAMPYIRTAAARGDDRAQYLLGIAHFNGDLAERDWVRAYALMILARDAGLPQAARAITEMDRNIPLEQRQSAALLAVELGKQSVASHGGEVLAADLVPPARASSPPPASLRMNDRPAPSATRVAPAPATTPLARPAVEQTAPFGPWRVQLGAFRLRANAEEQWRRTRARPELVGHPRIDSPAAGMTKLQAGGFATREDAARACHALSASGASCLVVRE